VAEVKGINHDHAVTIAGVEIRQGTAGCICGPMLDQNRNFRFAADALAAEKHRAAPFVHHHQRRRRQLYVLRSVEITRHAEPRRGVEFDAFAIELFALDALQDFRPQIERTGVVVESVAQTFLRQVTPLRKGAARMGLVPTIAVQIQRAVGAHLLNDGFQRAVIAQRRAPKFFGAQFWRSVASRFLKGKNRNANSDCNRYDSLVHHISSRSLRPVGRAFATVPNLIHRSVCGSFPAAVSPTSVPVGSPC